MATSVEIHDAVVTRGTFTLKVSSLSIRPGEVFALLGRTGSGKTVLLETIAGAFPADSGSVLVDGAPIFEVLPQDRGMGIVYQDYALFPHMTVFDNIAYGLRAHKVPESDVGRRVNAVMETFSISHISGRYPGTISGGESQRCALARALVLEPGMLLLDEPFSALDPVTRQKLYALLREVHSDYGCTVLFVTHEFSEVSELADRVGIMLDGCLRDICAADELFTKEFDPDVMRFLGRA